MSDLILKSPSAGLFSWPEGLQGMSEIQFRFGFAHLDVQNVQLQAAPKLLKRLGQALFNLFRGFQSSS
jgi:hypothetical protein